MKYRTLQNRKVLRTLARYNMKKAGLSHLNDKTNGKSLFAQRWREFLEVKDNEKASI